MPDLSHIIAEFEKVRDTPYRIPMSLAEEDDCCSGKAKRLHDFLKKQGYDVRYIVCGFRWSDLPLPKELLDLPHEDESTHVYLEVMIGDVWIAIDPTWDRGLSDIFPISQWDGLSATPIAVPALSYFSPEKSDDIMRQIPTEESMAEDMAKNGRFYMKFNEWLAQERKIKN